MAVAPFDSLDNRSADASLPQKLNTMWHMVPRRVKQVCGLTSLAVALTMGWAVSPNSKPETAAKVTTSPHSSPQTTPRLTAENRINKQDLDYFTLNNSVNFPQVEINKQRLPQIIKLLEQQPDLAVKMLTKRWLEAYSGPRKSDLINAYVRCGTIINILKNKFRAAGWDENIAYLGIAESHWDNNAVSPANAVGIFQILLGTGKLFKLKITADFDERLDPEGAAKLVISHLEDTAARLKNRDIDINLAGYNSNMVNELIAAVRDRRLSLLPQGRLAKVPDGQGAEIKAITYPLYLKFLALKLRSLPPDPRCWTKAQQELFNFIKENLEYPAKLFAINELAETELKDHPQLPAWQFTRVQLGKKTPSGRLHDYVTAQKIDWRKFLELNSGVRDKRGRTQLANLKGVTLRLPRS